MVKQRKRTHRLTCERCGAAFWSRDKPLNNRGRFCSRSCVGYWMSETGRNTFLRDQRNSPEFKKTLEAHLFSSSNPFNDPELRKTNAVGARERARRLLTGGNGRAMSEPQRRLAEKLGWQTEVAVSLGSPRQVGYPTHYKIDIAATQLLIGIEVDGHGHRVPSIRAKDAKKTAKLEVMGWTILRFTNQQILSDIESVVSTVMETVQSSTSKQAPPTTLPMDC